MASDDFNWDDDPFGGDLDFDDDFDSPGKKKGFLRSFTSGFLGGLVENSIGSTDARIKNLQAIMPKTYDGAFNNLRLLKEQAAAIGEDIKNESADSIQDLQYFAKKAAAKLSNDPSNRISNRLLEFSNKDFSDWEKPSYGGDKTPGMEETSDDEVKTLLDNEDANHALNRRVIKDSSKLSTEIMSRVGGQTIGGINTLNMSLGKTNHLLTQLVQHQRKVKARSDALQLNVLTRTYLTNVKFFKFMEASNHRVIAELKDIVRFGKMSDFEKSSTSQAVQKKLRDGFINSVQQRVGGVGEFFSERFGKDARGEALSGFSGLTSSLRMGLEMSDGMPINVGDMIGNMASKMFIDQLPNMIKSGKGQELLKKFEKRFPDQSKQFREIYKRVEDLGNVATYATGNAEELANTLAFNYKGGSLFDEDVSYEEFIENLPPGKRVPKKFEYEAFKKAKGIANRGIETVLDGSDLAGTTYSLKNRTLADGYEQTLWTKRDNRSLTEEIPKWLSEIHLSIEKIRTGDDTLKAMSYDFKKSSLIGGKDKAKLVLDTVLNKSSFSRQADNANSMVKNIDQDNALSKDAQKELAFQLAKQADLGMGFNPYNLVKLENHGVSKDIANEIRTVIKGQFGITDEDLTRFDTGTDIDRFGLATYLPTEEARKRVVGLAESSKNLKEMGPSISRDLDILKGSGYSDALVEAGIITVNKYGREEVNKSLLDKTLRGYIGDKDYNSSALLGATGSDSVLKPNASRDNNSKALTDAVRPTTESSQQINNTLTQIMSELAPALKDFSKVTGGFEGLRSDVNDRLDYLTEALDLDLSSIISNGLITHDKLTELIEKPCCDDSELVGGINVTNDLLKNILTKQNTLVKFEETDDTKKRILDAVNELTPAIKEFGKSFSGLSFDINPMVIETQAVKDQLTERLDLILESSFDQTELLDLLLESSFDRTELLNQILLRTPNSVTDDKNKSSEEKEADKEKVSLMNRIKQFSFKDMFNGGVDKLLKHQPLMLGGLLGGLAGVAAFNPKAAALLAGGAAAAVAYGKIKELSIAKFAADHEDLFEEGGTVPILEAWKLKRGDYFDLLSNKVITSWDQISGSVKDIIENVVIGAKRLAGKLFTAENKEVFIKGLSKAKEFVAKVFNALDPFGSAKRLAVGVQTRFYQMDVYKEGADSPTLIGKRFKTNAYYKKLEDGGVAPILGWNEIDGPVYDSEGNVLITQEEFDQGLTTSMGISVNKMGTFAKKAGTLTAGLLGKLKVKVSGRGKEIKDNISNPFKQDLEPIVASVDRIYHLLLRKWGLDPNEFPTTGDELDEIDADFSEEEPNRRGKRRRNKKGKPSFTNPSGLETVEDVSTVRLNSMEDILRKEALEKDEEVKDAIIKMSKNFGGEGDTKKEQKEGGLGLFGMLKTGFGKLIGFGSSLLGFMTGPLWSVVGTLGKFALSGLKYLPIIAGGILSLAKGIGRGIGGGLDYIRGGEKGRRAGKGNILKTGGGKLGLGLALSGAAYGLSSMGLIEEDGIVDKGLGIAGTATSAYAVSQLLAPGLTATATGMVGTAATTLGGAALTGATTLGTAAVAGGSAAWGVMAPLLFNPITLGALGIGAAGYGIYKFMKRGEGKQVEIRLTQYGLAKRDSKLAKKVLELENMLKDHIKIDRTRASFMSTAPISDALKTMINNQEDRDELSQVFQWFNARFKPVFLTHLAVLSNTNLKTLEKYDESKTAVVYEVAQQVHTTLKSIQPLPYEITPIISTKEKLLNSKQTTVKIDKLLTELKKYVDKGKKEVKQPDVLTVPSDTVTEREKLEKEKKGMLSLWNNSLNPFSKRGSLSKKLTELEEEEKRLTEIYQPGGRLAVINIRDLMVPGEPLDLFTAVRVAAYGNGENIPWRIEAVLKLERYCESLFKSVGGEVKFVGEIGALYGMFKDAFRNQKGREHNWCVWFRDRFLPVMTTYLTTLKRYRNGRPESVWKTLTATAKYEIAKSVVESTVEVKKDKFVPIWEIMTSPFDKGKSETNNKKAVELVKALGAASESARLKDPKTEVLTTHDRGKQPNVDIVANEDGSTTSVAREDKDRAVGSSLGSGNNGGSGSQASTSAPSLVPNRSEMVTKVGAMGEGGGMGSSGFAPSPDQSAPSSGVPMTPISAGGGDIDVNAGVVKNEGEDRGVSTPKPLAEKILIREMMAQGFTDPREIAMVLAQTRLETGDYRNSVENMRYTKPNTLVKLFREVRSLGQAKQLVAAGPQAIANTVYGGGKGKELGNTRPGDGWNLRGRGWMQTTGGFNYKALSKRLGIDLLNNPKLLSEDPGIMAKSAVDFFKNSAMMRSISQGKPFSYAGKGINPAGPPEMGKRESYYNDYLKKLTKGELTADADGFDKELSKVATPGAPPTEVSGSGGGSSTPPPPPPSIAKDDTGLKGGSTPPPPPPSIAAVDYNPPVAKEPVVSSPSVTPPVSVASTPPPSILSNSGGTVGINTPVKTQPAVATPPPPQNQSTQAELAKLNDSISNAVLASGGDQANLLKEVINQLAKLNENMAKPAQTVRLG